MKPWQGKVALVTGASSGIGRATALRLAELGCDVGLVGRKQPALDEAATQCQARGVRAVALAADVAETGACQRAVSTTVAELGRLDLLINSAGLSMRAPFDGSDLAAMERVMRVNFFGTLYATHYALPHVRKARGSLVALSSLTGKRGIPSYSIYGASKFAIQGLYDSLRLELRRDGVHVGVVAPGFVDTPLRERVLGPDGKPWDTPPRPPFRIWPVEKCVDRVVRLIVKRQKQALLPGFIGPLLHMDASIGGVLGDLVLMSRFPPDG